MDSQVRAIAFLSPEYHREQGRTAALERASIDSHTLPMRSAALDAWLAGYASVANIAPPVRVRFDARQGVTA